MPAVYRPRCRNRLRSNYAPIKLNWLPRRSRRTRQAVRTTTSAAACYLWLRRCRRPCVGHGGSEHRDHACSDRGAKPPLRSRVLAGGLYERAHVVAASSRIKVAGPLGNEVADDRASTKYALEAQTEEASRESYCHRPGEQGIADLMFAELRDGDSDDGGQPRMSSASSPPTSSAASSPTVFVASGARRVATRSSSRFPVNRAASAELYYRAGACRGS
jgi:hypothetical protein